MQGKICKTGEGAWVGKHPSSYNMGVDQKKNRVTPKCNPGKWKHGRFNLRSNSWFNFDPHPYDELTFSRRQGLEPGEFVKKIAKDVWIPAFCFSNCRDLWLQEPSLSLEPWAMSIRNPSHSRPSSRSVSRPRSQVSRFPEASSSRGCGFGQLGA